ncbi:hypothetical protein B0T26DRAFT_599774, partial [Lasiosphaeria miniovina]
TKGGRANAMLTALAWPFKESKAKKLLSELKQYKDTISLALATESIWDTKAIFATLTEMQQHEVYKWLYVTDLSPLHHKVGDCYEAGTGDLVFRSDQWKSWLEGDSRSVWIHGIPGAGKTILASHIIEALTIQFDEIDNTCVVYYYYYYGHNQDEAAPFLKWVPNQLCRRAEKVPGYLYKLYSLGSEPSFSSLLRAFEEITDTFDRVFLVVDAVDESMPRQNILRAIRDLATDERFRNVHILLISREYIDIE